MESRGDQIKKMGRHLGCALVGITKAEPMQEESDHLEEWLRRGYQGEMAWMEKRKEERKNPESLLPGARSIIVVGVNYYTPVHHEGATGTGKISRYAWGEDYHRIVKRVLDALVRWMESEFPGERTRVYVDTGPLMEKALAARAGIGWQGKHSNVISTEIGSWFFLGEILTTLQIEPDQPSVDHCGSCTRCIEACPTSAIVDPYVIDARKCLSYLTIEHRGPVSDDLASKNEGWIFGCDICQDVCPWNSKHQVASVVGGFEPREGNVSLPLEAAANVSREEFDQRFAGSPIRRAKHEGFLRNIEMVRRFPPSGKDAG